MFQVEKEYLVIGGKPRFIYAGDFSYGRIPRAVWRDRLLMMKAARNQHGQLLLRLAVPRNRGQRLGFQRQPRCRSPARAARRTRPLRHLPHGAVRARRIPQRRLSGFPRGEARGEAPQQRSRIPRPCGAVLPEISRHCREAPDHFRRPDHPVPARKRTRLGRLQR